MMKAMRQVYRSYSLRLVTGDFIISLTFYHRDCEGSRGTNRRFVSNTRSTWQPRISTALAQLHVIASVQPYHAIDDGRWAESASAATAQPDVRVRTLLNHGVRPSPLHGLGRSPLNPLLGVYCRRHACDSDGKIGRLVFQSRN